MEKMLLAALMASLLSACGSNDKAAGTSEAPKPQPPAAAASTTTPPPPAATASTAPAGEPEECQAYIKRVEACMAKASSGNAAATDMFRQQLDAARAQWAQISDRTALANACKAANDGFSQAAAMLKCE